MWLATYNTTRLTLRGDRHRENTLGTLSTLLSSILMPKRDWRRD